MFRKAMRDHHLSDIPISKGTALSVDILVNQFNPKWFKDPNEFRPERWDVECANLPLYVLFSFSGGPRGCIGKQLAQI